jgi:sugar lactone lactonase YvrE
MPLLLSPFLARVGLSAALLATVPACRPTSNTAGQITFTQSGVYPEGSSYDNRTQRFLVSSLTSGRIGQVTPNGQYAPFADDARLVSTIGLYLDQAGGRNRLLAVVADMGYNLARTSAATKGKLAALAIFDAQTGTITGYADLGHLRPGVPHFANDVAVDAAGNAYVTDSFAPIIYKVDKEGTASVFLEDTTLAVAPGSFGLNGIVYHPHGYLLVGKSDEGALLKVPLANPKGFTKIAAPGLDLSVADGLQLLDQESLLVVCHLQSKVYRLRSPDDFASVRSLGSFSTGPVSPTSLTRRDNESYVLSSHYSALMQKQNPPASEFGFLRVTFPQPGAE